MQIYISSDEYHDFLKPRKILHYNKTTLDGTIILIAEIEKPIIGQKYGLLDHDIKTLYLINRFEGDGFNMKKFPIYVHVFIVKDFNIYFPTSLNYLQNIAWACLYDNEKDAIIHKLN